MLDKLNNIYSFVLSENLKVLLTCIALLVLITVWKRRHLYYLSWKCDGPVYKPFVGNLFDFGTTGKSLYATVLNFATKYKTPFRAWFGPFMAILVTDPDDIQIILKHENTSEKPFIYKEFGKEWVGDGLITSKGDLWKSHRRLIAPTFSRNILENYMRVFVEQSNVLVQQLALVSGTNKAIDAFEYTTRCTLDIICETSMGIKINSQQGDRFGDLYIKSTQRAFEILYKRVLQLWFTFEPLYRISSLYQDFMQCCQVFHKLTERVIEEKRASQENQLSEKKQKSFVDELFRKASIDGENWTDKEIRDEISSMIAAGADTTSHSLAFTILLIAMFPEVQDKLFQEILSIDESIDGNDESINIETCNKLTYMGQVIHESLRLFPSTPMIGRYTTGDVKIKTNNLVIPKNVYVALGLNALHRDKAVWGKDAEKFDPENFSKENVRKRHPNSFVAFSGGQRDCIGLKFANLSMKVILFKLLKAYRLETDEKFDEIKCEFNLLLNKVGGWKVKLYSRKA